MVAEKVFAVIAESTRRDILEALAQESKAVGQLVDELGVSQPTVSKHLRVLREAGVVTMRAQGQKRFYGINTEPLELVSAWLDSLGAAAVPAAVAPAVAAPAAQAPAAQAVRPAAKAAEAGKGSAPAQSNGHERAGAAHVGVATTVAAVPGAAAQASRPATAGVPTQASRPAAATATPALPRVGAVQTAASAPAAGTRPAAVAPAAVGPSAGGTATGTVTRLAPAIVQSNDVDGGMQGQISRSVGRAANKAVDLLANLPALPKLRRKKD
ncbi:ArsR/SmtB family transcription factor [Arthrobacter sp. HY1533]|uniref:ArsR/SmtB family transcription factor n=1 Tax=Arthrobacter sp. HY1533 TaxID=2970919 RepID=UPI0022B9E44D|nr:metalloregulator ArsR/SmtB family transcription factor [Arthrobacter sp. HY1533]